jgi:hypothetical protein
MHKILRGMALSCVLLLAPVTPAMQSASSLPQKSVEPNNDIVFENLCAPGFDAEFDQKSMPLALDYQQLERVRIELLEQGFNPGFDSDPDIANVQLRQALAQYQAEYRLPVTGQVDAPTLAALSIPAQQSVPTKSEGPVQRAKPSKKK